MAGRVTSEQRRRQVVEVALRQYAERGLDATTRTSLATELGVDRVIVHRLYPDLDDLFDDVLLEVRALAERAIDEAARAADEAATRDEQWRAVLGVIVRAARSHRHAWQFLFLTPTGSEVATRLAELQREIAARVIDELTARAPTDGSERWDQETTWVTTFIYQGLFGAIAQHLEQDGTGDDARFVAHLAAMLGRLTTTDLQESDPWGTR